MTMKRGSLVMVAGLLLAACDGSSHSNFSTGMDSGKTPASMSPADRATLCTKVESFLPTLMSKADMCKLSGMMGAMLGMGGGDLKALCTAAYDACMKEPDDPVETTGDTASCSQGMSTCTATVGEIESCMNDLDAMMRAEMAKIPSCSQLTLSDFTATSTTTETTTSPASCTALEAKCPDMGETASAPMSH
jgi:hypothetical protein